MPTYEEILKKKSKDWNCPDMMSAAKEDIAKIPFSSPLLNWATYGGIPRGRITELHGSPGGGKSTTAIDLCYNAVKLFTREHEEKICEYREKVAAGKKEYAGPLEDLQDQGPKRVLYVDLEHTFDFSWAGKIGLHEGDIDVMEPPDVSGEAILNTVQEIIETGEVGLLILDSVPSLVPQAELDKKYGERTVASLAGLLTQFMRKVTLILARYDCTLVLINQIRENMDNPYVVKTPGGEALKFYSSLRLLFRLGSPVDFAGNELPQSTENPAGYIINVKVVKQKSAAFDRKLASYFLMAQSGIRPDYDYAKLAITKYGIILKKGGWFTMCDPFTGEILMDEKGSTIKVNGQVKVYDYLASNPEYYAKLKKFINNDINGIENVVESEDTVDEVESALASDGAEEAVDEVTNGSN